MREEVTALLENRNELLTITYFKIQELFDKRYGRNISSDIFNSELKRLYEMVF